MSIIDELQYYMDSASIGIVLELLLVTTCLSTIIYVVTKKSIYFILIIGTDILFYVLLLLSQFTLYPANSSHDDSSFRYSLYSKEKSVQSTYRKRPYFKI